jgi:hypothetical protein
MNQGALFEDPEDERYVRLRDGMIAVLRGPWGDSPPRIPEPTEAEKTAFAEAFARASRPNLRTMRKSAN